MIPDYIAKLDTLPEHMRHGIRGWIEHGHHIGGFLTALLSNDLMGAFAHADDVNTEAMGIWVTYLYNYAPSGCYGSPAKVEAWSAHRGLEGIKAEDRA